MSIENFCVHRCTVKKVSKKGKFDEDDDAKLNWEKIHSIGHGVGNRLKHKMKKEPWGEKKSPDAMTMCKNLFDWRTTRKIIIALDTRTTDESQNANRKSTGKKV